VLNIFTSLTVCIPAYNEGSNLDALFASLSESDLNTFDYEILLCDSGSSDNTREIFDYWVTRLNIKLITTYDANASQNLNAGIMSSVSKVFCRIDARARVAVDFFSVGYSYLRTNSEEYCAIGPSVQVIPNSDYFESKFLAKFFMSPFFMGPSKYKRSVFYRYFEGAVDTIYLGFFWTEDLRTINGFNVTLKRKQDIDLLKRLRLSTNKKLFNSCNLRAVYVLKHDTLKGICYRGHLQGFYAGLYSTPIRPAHVLPIISLATFVAISLISPFLGLFLISLYGLLVILAGLMEYPKLLCVPISLVAFPLVHLSFVIGNLRGLVSKTSSIIRGLT
jgi:glycosyltransferase involved in cell wall biosynthesis